MGARGAARQPRRRDAGSTRRRSSGFGPNTTGFRTASTPCTWTSSTGGSTAPSSTGCRREWREEQDRCQREIERHQDADQSYMDEGVQILELARNAQRLFERQEPREKRRLLNFRSYRTALGRAAKLLPPSANRLICWQKPPPSPRRRRALDSAI